MMTTAIPPGMMRMGSRLVPISKPFGTAKAIVQKFLVCLQFYAGDIAEAEELALLIAELERTRNHDADFLLMRRGDCREINPAVRAKLELKFDRVHQVMCRRSDAKGHPHGPNQMFADLVQLMGHSSPYRSDYYAFIPLEPDCTPTRPGWIGELIAAWRGAGTRGKAMVGFIHDNPVPHMNGVGVWPTNAIHRIPQLLGAGPQVPYDIYHRHRILPLAEATPLIWFRYRMPSITPESLFKAWSDGVSPCLFHGVKDGSARASVKARHITFTERATTLTERINAESKAFHSEFVDEVIANSGIKITQALADPTDAIAVPDGDVLLESPLGVQHTLTGDETTDNPTTIKIVDAMPPGFKTGGTSLSADHPEVDSPEMAALKQSNAAAEKKFADEQRDRLVALSGVPIQSSQSAKRQNVYTYAQKHAGVTKTEMAAILEAWKEGWTTRGWNPVVLTLREAAKHPKFDAFSAAVEKLPCVGDKTRMAHRFYRWLALDMVGGGLLTDWDVLPLDFTPDSLAITRNNLGPKDWTLIFSSDGSNDACGIFVSSERSIEVVAYMLGCDAQPRDMLNGNPHVSDESIAHRLEFSIGVMSKNLKHLSSHTVKNERKSVAMHRFLRGEA